MTIGFGSKINKDLGRPVVRLKGYYDLFALVDTGASLPVWVAEKDILFRIFRPVSVKKGLSFSGFGGSPLARYVPDCVTVNPSGLQYKLSYDTECSFVYRSFICH